MLRKSVCSYKVFLSVCCTLLCILHITLFILHSHSRFFHLCQLGNECWGNLCVRRKTTDLYQANWQTLSQFPECDFEIGDIDKYVIDRSVTDVHILTSPDMFSLQNTVWQLLVIIITMVTQSNALHHVNVTINHRCGL